MEYKVKASCLTQVSVRSKKVLNQYSSQLKPYQRIKETLNPVDLMGVQPCKLKGACLSCALDT